MTDICKQSKHGSDSCDLNFDKAIMLWKFQQIFFYIVFIQLFVSFQEKSSKNHVMLQTLFIKGVVRNDLNNCLCAITARFH